jgi:low molecular weight phosphotyrosine protein phosphatase
MFGEFGDGKSIKDPYYGGKSGFETTYHQVVAYSEAFLEYIKENRPRTAEQNKQ